MRHSWKKNTCVNCNLKREYYTEGKAKVTWVHYWNTKTVTANHVKGKKGCPPCKK